MGFFLSWICVGYAAGSGVWYLLCFGGVMLRSVAGLVVLVPTVHGAKQVVRFPLSGFVRHTLSWIGDLESRGGVHMRCIKISTF